MRLLYVVNDAGFFVSHRLPIALAARASGHDVNVATPAGEGVEQIVGAGLTWHDVRISRRGLNPVAEAGTIVDLVRLMRRVRPDLVHLVTMKPVLLGGIAARLAGVRAAVAAVAGLGYLSDPAETSRRLRRVTLPLLRVALGHPNLRVIFQNQADQQFLMQSTALRDPQAVLINGSGIELDRYVARPEPPPPVVVTFASRLLRPKGVAEFVAAGRLLRLRGLDVRFRVAGDLDGGNPMTVTPAELERWRAEGDVEILGRHDDIPALFAASHIVALPSYYGEGMPRVLLEAAACGRPVVTTDHPGCRDAVVAGQTGLVVPPRDAARLADAIATLVTDAPRRQAMGAAARQHAERTFDIESVVRRHLALYADLMEGEGARN